MNITIQELNQITNPSLIDIRPQSLYNLGHIKNAKNISYNSLIISPSTYLNKNEIYYIYCKYGQTSKGLSQFLNKQGYQTKSVIGGYDAWLKQKGY